MNLTEIAKKRMYETVTELFGTSTGTTILAGYARADQEVTKFKGLYDTFDGYVNQQAKKTTGVTGDKNSIYENLVKNTVKASRKALVYAKDQASEELQALFNVQEYIFEKLAQNEGIAIVVNIHNGLAGIGAPLIPYRVTAANITAIGQGIIDFKSAEGEPRVAKAESEAGTQGIKTIIPLMDDCLEILDDLIIHGLDEDDETERDFINKYRNARKIIVLGTRHTGIDVTFNDAETGLGIEHGVLKNVELDKTAPTNILGVAAIPSMQPGTYHFEFSAAGYVTQVMVIKIERGVTLEMTVKLARV